jgi:sugar/nucleoside kinase (ribokinase family)
MTEAGFDVVVVGNAGVDTNVYFPGGSISFDVEASFTENVDYVGQAGGYASRGYASLGKRTAFVGHVGDDHNGQLVRDTFACDGIDTRALWVDPAGTARSINFMYPDGRRRNFYDGKSHMTLQPDLAPCRAVLSGARLAHFNIPNWARWLLPIARELGVTVACDIQDVAQPDDPYRQDFMGGADLLFFSAVNYRDPTPLVQAFLRQNPALICIAGMGAEGCALATWDGVRFFPPVPMDEPVIDTNGAGDALAVGFATSYVLDGFSLEEAVLRGQIAARYTCTIKGSSSHLISRERLNRLFQALR